ncbi:MAG TPA: acyltransferase [Flavisolibacter sp.]
MTKQVPISPDAGPYASRKYYPALDGLRGIAILLVVFYHNFGFINYFFFGWLGVDLFFVLSGFLITEILLHTREKPGYLRNFYMRRVLRIAPLYYLALLLFLVILPRIPANTIDFSFYRQHQAWFWTYLQNWLLISRESSANTTALHHFWSLAVEEQYYLFWPLLVLLIRKPQVLITSIALLLITVIGIRIFMWLNQVREFNYFGFYTFTRIDGLCIGSMLAVILYSYPKFLRSYSTLIILGLAAFNFLFFFINRANQFTFPYFAMVGYTTFAVIFAMLVYEATNEENRLLQRLLQSGILKFLGKYSYGIYIWHWPVYLLLHRPVRSWLAGVVTTSKQTGNVIAAIGVTAVAVLISVASFHLFEKYFINLKKNYQ